MHLLVVWLQLNAIHAAGSQMPVEKTAAELNSFSQQIVDNETSPDWNLSNGLYDDLTKFYAESSGASSCGSFDDYTWRLSTTLSSTSWTSALHARLLTILDMSARRQLR